MEKAESSSSRKADRLRQSILNEPVDITRKDCELRALRQFTCEQLPTLAIKCKPLWRTFQMY
jgi:hypothetical protein